ncbi:uncharacterized protein LOC136037803 [Artemia franciscana]
MCDYDSFEKEATTLLHGSPINRLSVTDFLIRFSREIELISGPHSATQDALLNMSEDKIKQMLEEIVSELKETATVINANTSLTDHSFVSRLSSGLARYGVLYGVDDSNLLPKAKAPLIDIPKEIEILGKSKPTLSKSFLSRNIEQSNNQINKSIENGWVCGLGINLPFFSTDIKFVDQISKSEFSSSRTKIDSSNFNELRIYPVGAFRIPFNQMILSSETTDALKRMNTDSEAVSFLQTFGSHYPSDVHHYGGMVHFSCELRASGCETIFEAISNTKKEFEASLSFWPGFGKKFKAEASYQKQNLHQQKDSSSHFRYSRKMNLVVYGPQAVRSVPLFCGLMKKSPEDAVIIDRGDLKNLVPVWTLLGSEFQNQAELIRNTWMNMTKDAKSKDIQDLRCHYDAIYSDVLRRNMLPLRELRRLQERNPLLEQRVLHCQQDTDQKSKTEAMTLVADIETETRKYFNLDRPGREHTQIIPKPIFTEDEVVSAFIVDSPPDMTTASYRLLHRLGLSYHESCEEGSEDCSESEEDFYFEIKPTVKKKKYDIPMLLTMFSLRDTVSILQLLLESRFAIQICSKDTIELLRITQRLEEGIFLGEDKRLPRVAIISQVKSFDSFTGKVMEDLFNLKTSFDDFKTSGLEVGQGFVCFEDQNLKKGKESSEPKEKNNSCIVIHIRGNFEPYWTFLTDFIDYLVIEDEFISGTNKHSYFMNKYSRETRLPQFVTVWIPNLPNATSNRNPFFLIEGSLHYFVEIQRSRQLRSVFRKAGQHEHSMYSIFPLKSFLSHFINDLRKMYFDVSTMDGLENYRSDILLLQKSFAKEGQLQDKLNDFQYSNDNDKYKQIQEQIFKQKSIRSSFRIKKDPLIRYFFKGFEMNNIDSILLHIRVLSDAIAINIKTSKIVAHLTEVVNQKTNNCNEITRVPSKGSKYEDEIKYAKKELSKAIEKKDNAFLSIRHLWREASLLYSSGTNGELVHLPQMAASCLIAGETLELYDGDANMINVDWITEIFKNLTSLLPNKKIFVLSVLGEQSSGKSTLLNTMFGIQLATSVGQCTRGLTMTLIKTVNRQEYDYVIIFDSEGVRSPEHTGIDGCVKRDNKIATLSILPSDAVILLIKGENDKALKEILPIVALAYKGSKLAEERGGMLSCKLFAAYNQIKCDEENEHMLQNIFSKLSTTVIESFKQIESLQDLNVHTSISFPKMFSCKEDIQVFGCNTKGDQPSDIPNENFSLQIVNLREHIHNQVVSQVGWSARSIESLERYFFLVWNCLNESNFELSFQSVIERHNFTELECKFENLRDLYYETYEIEYDKIKDKYKEEHSCDEDKINEILDDLKVTMRESGEKFEIEMAKVFEERQNQEVKDQYLGKVKDTIRNITNEWDQNLKLFLENQFLFDRKISEYLKKMKDEIIGHFKAKSINEKSKDDLIAIFEKFFNDTRDKVRKENPPKDVKEAVKREYLNNQKIKTLGINLLDENQPSLWRPLLNKANDPENEIVNWISQSNDDENEIRKIVGSVIIKITSGTKYYSKISVHNAVYAIERSLREHNRTFSKGETKKIHRTAHDLLVDKLVWIQKNWEEENSVYMRFLSKKEEMKEHCLEIASGLGEVDIMASRLNNFFQKQIIKGFQTEVKERVMANIKNQWWPKSPKNVQGHMDLYLIEEVEPKGIKEVLRLIKNPYNLKAMTTSRLIYFEIDTILKDFKLKAFQDQLEHCFRDTYSNAPKEKESGLKSVQRSFQFKELFQKFQIFKSTFIADELIKEMHTFGWTNLKQMSVKFEDRHINAIVKSLSVSKPINKVIISKEIWTQLQNSCKFKAAFCISCQTPCPLCKSPCFYEFSHKGRHDTFHQPIGLTGWRDLKTKKLRTSACNTVPIDYYYVLPNGEHVKNVDFSKKFNTWLQPDRARPVTQYREYLIQRYNKEIAKYYSVNPTDKLHQQESLDIIKSKIKRNVDFYKDFPDKT